MNWTRFKRVFPQALAWTALVILSGAVALAQNTGAQPTDGQIEMGVVHALDASEALKNDLITAATIESEVTLSGTVSDEASRELAASIAAQVPGVTKVHNNLQVGNPQAAASANNLNMQQTADNPPENADNAADSATAPEDETQPSDSDQTQPAPDDSGQAEAQNGPPAQPQYAPGQMQPPPQPPAPPQPMAYDAPNGPVTIPAGTLLQVRTSEPVNSKRASEGEQVQFTVIADIAVGNVLAIPRGATVHGVVTDVRKAGTLRGTPELALRLTALDMGGQSYPLDSTPFKVKGPSKTRRTVGNALRGGFLGTMVGCAVGRGEGCLIGAGAGVAAGTASSAASPGPGVWIPAEALVDFHLTAPLTVTPVSAREAARLAEGLYPGGPNLYRRGYPPPYGRPYAGYPYGYPPVYYRPYYAVGGYYYWR